MIFYVKKAKRAKNVKNIQPFQLRYFFLYFLVLETQTDCFKTEGNLI